MLAYSVVLLDYSSEYHKSCWSTHDPPYEGSVQETSGGRACMHWDATYPFTANADDLTPLTVPGNYCRKLTTDESDPICYTLNHEVSVENCDVPRCGK